MWPNLQETADLVPLIEDILNEKLQFLCSILEKALLDYSGNRSNEIFSDVLQNRFWKYLELKKV